MPLDLVVQHFTDAGSTVAIQRFFIDMPVVPGKICMIRQVQVRLVQLSRANNYGLFFAMSVDPDHVLASTVIMDSTMFLSGQWENVLQTTVGFQLVTGLPWIFHFPEGIKCPYTRLPFFVQHSNTGAPTADWVITVLYEFVARTPQELAIAVMRRGRGVGRRVPESP